MSADVYDQFFSCLEKLILFIKLYLAYKTYKSSKILQAFALYKKLVFYLVYRNKIYFLKFNYIMIFLTISKNMMIRVSFIYTFVGFLSM